MEATLTASPEYTEQIVERGEALYERSIRHKVETEENIGKLISIDILSGDYEIGDSLIETGDLLRARRPNSIVYGARIGYDAVYSLGGSQIERIDKCAE